jgi:hypothetical protein
MKEDAGYALRVQVPFEIENRERIPAQRYYDEGFHRLECERRQRCMREWR